MPSSNYPFEFMPYVPAEAVLDDKSRVRCVLFWGYHAFLYKWGASLARSFVDIRKVAEVKPSECQMPPSFADEIYLGGGDYHYFTVIMNDGRRFYYAAGSVVDFLEFPEGYGQSDIRSVDVGWTPKQTWTPQTGLTNEGRNIDAQRRAMMLKARDYAWCLFSETEEQLRRWELAKNDI